MKKIYSRILLLFLLLTSLNLVATNYYVSNSGNDSNDGLSLEKAYKTLQYSTRQISAGDTIFVDNGEYSGFDMRSSGGTTDHPIVFKALGENVLINKSGPKRSDGINIEGIDHIVIDGFIVNNMIDNGNGIRIVLSNFCVVRNCKCDNNAERGIFTAFTDDILIENNLSTNAIDEHGIYVSNSSDRAIVRYNECYGNNGIGIHMNGDESAGEDGINHNPQIYGNILHDNNRAAGINLDGVQSPIIYNNLIYNNHFAQGIALFQQDGAIVTNNAKIYNNTIIVPADGRWGILVKEGANVNTEIYNNIIINQHSWRGCIAIENKDGLKSDHNILNDKMSDDGDGSTINLAKWRALGFDNNSLLASDEINIFVNPSSRDYHLKNLSQAIDSGTDRVKNIVPDDMENISRPQGVAYDIGAFEKMISVKILNTITQGIHIYPNPAHDHVLIDMDEIQVQLKTIKLLNIHGQAVQSYGVNSQLNVANIKSGMYFLQFESQHGEVIIKRINIF